jgi:hypothetical protein
MNESFIAFVFSAYVTVGGVCNYQKVAIAMNNHNQVIVVTDRLNVHLHTIAPMYKYKYMEDIGQEDSTKHVYYGFRCFTDKNSDFTFSFEQKKYFGDPEANRLRKRLFSTNNNKIFTISSKACETKQIAP